MIETAKYIGIDIGGAHLKLTGLCRNKKIIFSNQIKCPVWKGINVLENQLKSFKKINQDSIAGITMTAELCDNFENREQGAKKIKKLLKKLNFKKFFLTNKKKKRFQRNPQNSKIISMNWLSTADFVAQKISNCLIIDFGSTTTDLILIKNKKCLNKHFDDFSRLNNYELIYTGLTRTPIMSINNYVKINEKKINIIPELFSNTSDLYRVLKKLPKEVDQYETLDGRSKSIINSYKRLSRNLGFDYQFKDKRTLDKVCRHLSKIQLQSILNAVKKLLYIKDVNTKIPVILCGVGKNVFKNKIAKKFEVIDFSEFLESDNEFIKTSASYNAPATACAFLVSDLK